MHRVQDVYLHEGTVNGYVHVGNLYNTTCSHAQSFNGTKICSLVVLDNASIHYLNRIEGIITSSCAFICYQLLPYS